MKVLLTTPTFPPFNSGLGNAVLRQAEMLTQRGISVVVATGGSQRSMRNDGKLRVEQFAVTGAEQFLRNPIRGDVSGYETFLRHEDYDVLVLNAWQTWSTDVALRIAPGLRAKKYVYSHCISTNTTLPFSRARSLASYMLWRPYWWDLKRKMRLLDGVIFVADGGDDSRFDDLRIAREAGIPSYIIPNSLAEAALPRLKGARDQLIAVGSYTPAKGFDFVLDAYAQSSARNRVPLALFGQEHTAYSEVLRAQIGDLGLDPAFVTLHAGVEGQDLLDHYRRAKLFLSGSHTECQPLVLLDAMATGTPFVARSTGCISRMAGGLAVRTPIEAAAAIDKLLADGASWSEFSAAGLAAAESTHSPDRSADLLVALVEGRLAPEVWQ